MPCYSVNLISIDLPTADRGVLQRAVAALGWTIQGNVVTFRIASVDSPAKKFLGMTVSKEKISYQTGSFTLAEGKAVGASSVVPQINQLRKEYAYQAIQTAGQKFGWRKVKVAENKFKLSKGV